jgi:ABC-type transport system substrate-binding protein
MAIFITKKAMTSSTMTLCLNRIARFHDGTPGYRRRCHLHHQSRTESKYQIPHRVEWEGVTMEKISDTEMTFRLRKHTRFLWTISRLAFCQRIFGRILPTSSSALSDYNIHAIGSGPYSIKSIKVVSGIPEYLYVLEAHKNYTLGRPYIDTISYHHLSE